MFVNREDELYALKKRLPTRKAELIVVYGRRRVGKTELIRKFVEGKPHIYFLADRQSEREQLMSLSAILGEYFKDEVIKEQGLNSWDMVFKYLNQRLKGRSVLVFDEFPYLVDSNKALPSIIQKHWDQELKDKSIFLVLCGSSISFMERKVLAYKSPLYGRRTGQIFLQPFKLAQVKEFFPKSSLHQIFDIYSCFGGIPAYLAQVDPQKDIFSNIEDEILPHDKFLHNEVNFILMAELRQPKHYFFILRAIAFGKTTINEVVQFTKLERGTVGKYIDILMNLGLVKKMLPVTEKAPAKSRKGYYVISDNFFRFWFRFIYPNLSYIEEKQFGRVMEKIKRDFSTFQGSSFENVAKEYLVELNTEGKLPFAFDRIGRWWNRGHDVDLVALDEKGKRALFCECKYSNKAIGEDIYRKLLEKSKAVPLKEKEAKCYYALFSKSGYTEKMLKIAAEVDVLYLFNFNPKGWEAVH